MRHEHKRHAGIGRHLPKQPLEGAHSASGRAHSGYQKFFLRSHLGGRL
jgi:hypothetical protein